jgi:alkaline phosphatase D
MRRMFLVTVALVAVVVFPASASARGFSLGVAAGDVSSSSAILWAHADKSGKYTLKVSTKASFRSLVASKNVTASKSHDNTVQAVVKGLPAATKLFYRFAGKGSSVRSDVGQFTTAPKPSANKTIRFAFSGDEDAQPTAGSKKPFYNNFDSFKRMLAEKNNFNIDFGDTIYSDSEVPNSGPIAMTVAAKWAKYKQNLKLKNLSKLRSAAAMYNHWDDHEFINDFTRAEQGGAIYSAGVKAFRDYQPVTYSASKGIYRSERWGSNLEIFFLDERSFRSAKASAGGTCDNPATPGQPDFAPTAPQTTRSTFAAIAPSLAQPVSAACLAKINDPSRTMLGASQLARFESAIKASKATFKVIMNEVPIQQFYALPYDRWEGYESERRKLVDFLTANVKNTIFLTTDVHGNLVNTIKFSSLGESGPAVDSGIYDFTTGPVATMTYSKEIASATGSADAGGLVPLLFFKPPPPGGVGMKCAGTDVFSYSEVTVTSSKLTGAPKDQTGQPVKDAGGGTGCDPLTITKK